MACLGVDAEGDICYRLVSCLNENNFPKSFDLDPYSMALFE